MTSESQSGPALIKLFAVGFVLAASFAQGAVSQYKQTLSHSSCPSGVHPRKEYREMSPDEWSAFKSAVYQLMTIPPSSPGNYTTMFEEFCHEHYHQSTHGHKGAQFLPWHRLFLAKIERALQAINPEVYLPYWDWTLDWNDPISASIVSDKRYLYLEECEIRLNSPKFGNDHCVYRSPNISSWYPWETVEGLMREAPNYENFSRVLETTMHNRVHRELGGDMFYVGSAACDPIFILHHTQIDRIWAVWQSLNDHNLRDYNGTHYSNTTIVSQEDVVPPFNVSVASVLDTTSLCYSYPLLNKGRPRTPMILENHQKDYQHIEPPELPEEDLRLMGMDVEAVRADEAFLRSIMQRPLSRILRTI